MASINDVFNALNDIKGKLDQLHADELNEGAKIDATNGKLDAVQQTITDVGTAINGRLDKVINEEQLANALLLHLTTQGQTIICALEHISANTCTLVNLADAQLRVARLTQASARTTAEILLTSHPEAALELRRRDELAQKIDECCPPEPEPAPCDYKPCEDPGPFKERGKNKRDKKTSGD